MHNKPAFSIQIINYKTSFHLIIIYCNDNNNNNNVIISLHERRYTRWPRVTGGLQRRRRDSRKYRDIGLQLNAKMSRSDLLLFRLSLFYWIRLRLCNVDVYKWALPVLFIEAWPGATRWTSMTNCERTTLAVGSNIIGSDLMWILVRITLFTRPIGQL